MPKTIIRIELSSVKMSQQSNPENEEEERKDNEDSESKLLDLSDRVITYETPSQRQKETSLSKKSLKVDVTTKL